MLSIHSKPFIDHYKPLSNTIDLPGVTRVCLSGIVNSLTLPEPHLTATEPKDRSRQVTRTAPPFISTLKPSASLGKGRDQTGGKPNENPTTWLGLVIVTNHPKKLVR